MDKYEQILLEFTGNRFPRGFGTPARCNDKRQYYIFNGINGLKKFINQCCETNCYMSVYSFKEYDQTKRNSLSAIIDTIPLDFDDEVNPSNSLRDLKALMGWAKKKGLQFRIQYSGNKGFHAFLDCEPIELNHPKDALKLFVKQMKIESGFQTLNDSNEIIENPNTIDMIIIGDLERLIRIPNTLNGKTCRYCIPLDPQMLPFLSMEDIVKMAESKSEFISKRHNNNLIRDCLIQCDKDAEILLNERKNVGPKIKNPDDPFEDYPGLDCKAYLHFINNGAGEGMRQAAMIGILHAERVRGKSKEEVYSILLDFNEKCKPKLSFNEIERTLNNHWKKTYSRCTFFSKISNICKICETGKNFT